MTILLVNILYEDSMFANMRDRLFPSKKPAESKINDLNILTGLSFEDKEKQIKNFGFKTIGEGSGRVVYSIDDQKVIKIAKTPAAFKYNENEFKLFNCNKELGSKYLARVFEKGEDSSWVTMEKVTPVRGEQELNQRLNKLVNEVAGGQEIFSDIINIGPMIERARSPNPNQKSILIKKFNEINKPNSWFSDLYNLLTACKISAHDLRPDNWGIRKDGSLVILDFGFEQGMLEENFKI